MVGPRQPAQDLDHGPEFKQIVVLGSIPCSGPFLLSSPTRPLGEGGIEGSPFLSDCDDFPGIISLSSSWPPPPFSPALPKTTLGLLRMIF